MLTYALLNKYSRNALALIIRLGLLLLGVGFSPLDSLKKGNLSQLLSSIDFGILTPQYYTSFPLETTQQF